MVKPTPDPPEIRFYPTTGQVDPNACPGAISFFAVRPGIPIPDALSQASEFLRCASASAYELTDSVPPAFRPLVWSIIHLVESARALEEACVAGLETEHKP